MPTGSGDRDVDPNFSTKSHVFKGKYFPLDPRSVAIFTPDPGGLGGAFEIFSPEGALPLPRRRRRAQTDSRARLVRVALRSHLPPSSPR